MEHPNLNEDACLAALCQRLGHLWPEQQVEVCDEAAPTKKLEECKLMLVCKILSNPSVNLQAFQNTMNRAWHTKNVEISHPELGLYVAKFTKEADKLRVLENGPWLFQQHLVILKPWLPDTPLHCYDFTTCAF